MSELTKTAAFLVVALASVVLAVATRPRAVVVQSDDRVGQPLFPDFSDPLSATGLEVVSFDEELSQIKRFEVEQQSSGVWVIPSHQNYPADAQDRLAAAATMFVDLKVISVVSDAEGAHEEFGVVEPDPQTTALGAEGVGTLVTIQGLDEAGNSGTLASLIIGKAVQGVEGQHYVRQSGKSRSSVYQVEIDPSKLSTRFEDWIETDLLGLNPLDIRNITLRDYSIDVGVQRDGTLDNRLAMTVHEEAGRWLLDEFYESQAGQFAPAELLPGEELNASRLSTLRDALGDLKIVNVERKPPGLGADLKADKGFLSDDAGMASLEQRGFYPIQRQDGGVELLSSNGELLISTQDGVQYVLRFGQIAGMDGSTAPGLSGTVNRYLFVTALVDQNQFPELELEPMPEGAPADDAGDAALAEISDELAAEIERVNRENQRRRDERDEKLEKAGQLAASLSYRFADWYYIISDDVYKKLRLRRNDLVSVSAEAAKSGDGIEAFRELQRQGLTPAGDGIPVEASAPSGN